MVIHLKGAGGTLFGHGTGVGAAWGRPEGAVSKLERVDSRIRVAGALGGVCMFAGGAFVVGQHPL